MRNFHFKNIVHKKKKICIIFTGGTISMIKDKETGVLVPASNLEDLIQSEPELQDIARLDFVNLFNLDSSDLNFSHYDTVSNKIIELYNEFDGFVIATGTDTMAYFGTGLSFLLKNLMKPVVLTGSQFPLSGGMRSDGRINLFNSILFAKLDFHEVGICFGGRLLRANRSTKMDAFRLDAFDSPNFQDLGFISNDLYLNQDCIKNSGKTKKIGKLINNVVFLKISPDMHPDFISSIPDDIKGVVIEGFGSSGNIPQKLLDAIKNKSAKGVIFALKSQCIKGKIDLGAYEGSAKAKEIGAWSCKDMTSEAALLKLTWILNQNVKNKQNLFESSLIGELSE
ncbi:MAG: asparaginase [Candidatus Gracilibacteria bacterium]|jgi:L-asparaginase|nr:asparaginase [Candidatus Gracilibacteria bacterium]